MTAFASASRTVHRLRGSLRRAGSSLLRWFDAGAESRGPAAGDGVDWVRIVPFIGLHLMCFGVIWVGWSPVAVGVAVALYLFRMFALTAFYHRYFSHRSFRTNRAWQLVFAVLGNTAVQRGPLWWAAHHRKHHRHADTDLDVHSPHVHGLWWSHMGWFTTRSSFRTDVSAVPDLARFPELRLLDRFNVLVPIALAVGCFFLGETIAAWRPGWGTSGAQMLVWGFFISTTLLFHVSCTINSLAHRMGRRRYETRDESRNSGLLALLTLGEGWHNNHHHYPAACRQGHRWWEIDVTWYVLAILERLGIVHGVKRVPDRVLARTSAGTGTRQ